ncbi:MAG: hypothetical protein IKP32_00740 [Clostridia bacterium]|nr:hypothetical protein [Clostridia bacterium]
MAGKKRPTPAQVVREKTQEAAIQALQRLSDLLLNPDTGNGDVLKAAALILERVYPLQAEAPAGGDFDICVKEE